MRFSEILTEFSTINAGQSADLGSREALFWEEVTRSGTPLVDACEDDPGQCDVTFLYRAVDPTIRSVRLSANRVTDKHRQDAGVMTPVPGTGIWGVTLRLPADLRCSYGFSPSASETPEPLGSPQRPGPPVLVDPLILRSAADAPGPAGTGRGLVGVLRTARPRPRDVALRRGTGAHRYGSLMRWRAAASARTATADSSWRATVRSAILSAAPCECLCRAALPRPVSSCSSTGFSGSTISGWIGPWLRPDCRTSSSSASAPARWNSDRTPWPAAMTRFCAAWPMSWCPRSKPKRATTTYCPRARGCPPNHLRSEPRRAVGAAHGPGQPRHLRRRARPFSVAVVASRRGGDANGSG